MKPKTKRSLVWLMVGVALVVLSLSLASCTETTLKIKPQPAPTVDAPSTIQPDDETPPRAVSDAWIYGGGGSGVLVILVALVRLFLSKDRRGQQQELEFVEK